MDLPAEAWEVKADFETLAPKANSPDHVYREMVRGIIQDDPGVKKVTALPNWGYSWMQVPHGMLVEFDANSKFKADLFFTDMWSGAAMCPVETKINELDILGRLPNVHRNVKISAVNPPRFKDSDGQFWTPCIGSHQNYIGLYTTDRENPRTHMSEKIYMVIASTSIDEKTYEEMEKYFIECENSKMTYREVFYNNVETEQFRALIMRNRRRVAYDFAQSLGVEIRFRKYSKTTPPCNIAHYQFETESNCVHFPNSTTMIYYRNATNTAQTKDGLIVARSPLQGPVVYVGPRNNENSRSIFNGAMWTNDHNNGFPTDMGLRLQPTTFDTMIKKIGLSKKELSQCLLTDNGFDNNEMLTRTFPYFERSAEWKIRECQMGFTTTSVISCRPVCVKIF